MNFADNAWLPFSVKNTTQCCFLLIRFSLFVSFGKHKCFCYAVTDFLTEALPLIIHKDSVVVTTCFASQWRNYKGYTKQEDTTVHMNEKSSHTFLKLIQYIWRGEKVAGTRPRQKSSPHLALSDFLPETSAKKPSPNEQQVIFLASIQ